MVKDKEQTHLTGKKDKVIYDSNEQQGFNINTEFMFCWILVHIDSARTAVRASFTLVDLYDKKPKHKKIQL